ncbi:transglutaminase 5, like [Notolabrus celidotus]|uniref:transglutaminase 5, like n=1 Tax=Notolabrus celidotus TaxID=1203425 RepID=UPI0014900530|nr:transglutaminase 5, like [Notolabrus celidotus]XP_034544601.1 transglutaminase 5, like [Notolabrus celidotus]XP_034544609.1 transglutaminase 5, like [Notolabrus celidotus]
MEDLSIKNISLEKSENVERHRTEDFSSSKALVVRRGAPFRIRLQLEGRPFNPKTDSIRIKVMLGRLYVIMPVTFSKKVSTSHWKAFMDPEGLDLMNPSIFISSPASASVGCYRFQLFVFTQGKQRRRVFGRFILLCNPWCQEDTVYIPFEDQREEYIQNDSGLLFMGTAKNIVARPWSFDQYESGVLETCLNLLQVSPQHQKNRRKDYLNRNNPVYISRVVSAMINSEDDRGVLKGKWSGEFKEGVNPSSWTGSGDILKQWAETGYSPVKYGQCWVFAAVMCTVMRVLGIPCRVVTNFNSAHDKNDNLVIEEFYSESGKKLNLSKDSIWNFHVWVECWMTRPDIGSGMDGWQVLDPTPQERSGGVFCCGPAPVKAIKDRRIDLVYDIPFVYAEVNADIHMIVLSGERMLSFSKDTERVGSFICTKAVGHLRHQNITGDYKYIKSPTSTLSSRSSTHSDDSTLSRGSSKGVFVILDLEKAPVAGEPVRFSVRIINKQTIPKMMKVHLNAQAKEYHNSPSDTFWETHGVIKLAPMEDTILHRQILPAQYEDVVGDDLINLAVVLEDMGSQERVLAMEEFNIASPLLNIQIADEDSIVPNQKQTATVTFTNPYSHPVSGVLTVAGAGLIQGKIQFRMPPLGPRGVVEQRITFVPSMAGTKMLQANLSLANMRINIRGFKMVSVSRA